MHIHDSLEGLVSTFKTVQDQWIDTYTYTILPYHQGKLSDFLNSSSSIIAASTLAGLGFGAFAESMHPSFDLKHFLMFSAVASTYNAAIGFIMKKLYAEKYLSEQKNSALSNFHDNLIGLTSAVLTSEKKYHTLFQHMPGFGIYYSQDGRIIEVNALTRDTFGFDSIYPVGITIFDIISPQSLPLVRTNLEKRLRGEFVAPYEIELVTQQGKSRTALVDATFSTENNFLAFLTDITELKQVQQYASLFMHFANKSPMMFNYSKVVVNPMDGAKKEIVQWTNDAFIKGMGYASEEIVGIEVDRSPIRSKKNDPAIYAEIARQTHEHGGFQGVIWNKKKNGTEIKIYLETFEFLFGGETYYGSSAQDITADEKLKAELRQAISSRDDFMRVIRHDLRTPFNAIYNFAEFLLDPEITPAETAEYARIIFESSKAAVGLIKNLEALSAIESGMKSYLPEYFSLKHIVNEKIDNYKTIASGKNICITNCIDETVCAYADSDVFAVVTNNLIANAVKFAKKDISIKTEPVNDTMLKVMIIDDGVGMPQETIETIMTTDKRITTPGTAGELGSGFGTKICKKYALFNKGIFGLESEGIGKGTTAYFTVPKGVCPETDNYKK